jgi:hypothetical protein
MRYYSYIFHGVLAAFLFAVALVPLLSGIHNLQLRMLPWEGRALTFWLLGLSLFGLLSVLLAVMGKTRVLLLLWSIIVILTIIWGYFLRPYYFGGFEAFRNTLLLLAGAILAAMGAWYAVRSQPARR